MARERVAGSNFRRRPGLTSGGARL